jgi:hypothetical protein
METISRDRNTDMTRMHIARVLTYGRFVNWSGDLGLAHCGDVLVSLGLIAVASG